VTQENAEALGITDITGAYIAETTRGGPADKAGVQLGDIVKTVDGNTVKSPTELTRRIADVRVGEKVTLGVLRNGKMINLTLTAALRPSEEDLLKSLNGPQTDDSSSSGSASGAAPVIGLSVKAITPDVRKAFGLDDTSTGLVITDVAGNSDGAQKGLKPGDVIVLANNQPITSQSQFSGIVADLKKQSRPSILLLVRRDGRNIALPLTLADPAPKK
jgi:serine protease Do